MNAQYPRHVVVQLGERQWMCATFQYRVNGVPVFTLTGEPKLKRDEAVAEAASMITEETR